MITKTRTYRDLSLMLTAVITLGLFAATPVTVRAADEYIIITPSSAAADRGDTLYFTAAGYDLGGSGNPAVVTNTSWRVSGESSSGTTIAGSGDSAALTIGSDETAQSVTVSVESTSPSYSGVAATASVTINPPSSDATLQSLTVSDGTLSPAFNANTTSYNVSVDNSVTLITVTAMANHSKAAVTAGNNSHSLSVGTNTITVTITAGDGTIMNYIITVTRAGGPNVPVSDATLKSIDLSNGTLSPRFSANTTSYNVNVGSRAIDIDIMAVPNDAGAAVSAMIGQTVIVPVSNMLNVNLNVGANIIKITVTAVDGTTKAYTITVTRASSGGSSGGLGRVLVNPGPITISPLSAVQSTIPVGGYTITRGDGLFRIEIDSETAETIRQASQSLAIRESYSEKRAQGYDKLSATAAAYAENCIQGKREPGFNSGGFAIFYRDAVTAANVYEEIINEGGTKEEAFVYSYLVANGVVTDAKVDRADVTALLSAIYKGGRSTDKLPDYTAMIKEFYDSNSRWGSPSQKFLNTMYGADDSSVELTPLSPYGNSSPAEMQVWFDAYDANRLRTVELYGGNQNRISTSPEKETPRYGTADENENNFVGSEPKQDIENPGVYKYDFQSGIQSRDNSEGANGILSGIELLIPALNQKLNETKMEQLTLELDLGNIVDEPLEMELTNPKSNFIGQKEIIFVTSGSNTDQNTSEDAKLSEAERAEIRVVLKELEVEGFRIYQDESGLGNFPVNPLTPKLTIELPDIVWEDDIKTATLTGSSQQSSGANGNGGGPDSLVTIGSAENGMFIAGVSGGVFLHPAAANSIESISVQEGSIILSLERRSDGAAQNGQNAPVIIFMPYELNGAAPNSIVMYEKDTGRTIAHSFWQDGLIVAAVTSPGHYDAKEETIAYGDTEGHWAESGIAFAASHGLISGAGGEMFRPDEAITRADFVMALGVLAGADMSGYTWSSFKDVQGDSPSLPYIEWAVKNGIVQGVGDNCFVPENVITREQMAVMMANYAKATNQPLPVSSEDNIFADDVDISGWAAYSVMRAQWAGVMAGKQGNLFDPKGSATRAEASEILRRFAIAAVDG